MRFPKPSSLWKLLTGRTRPRTIRNAKPRWRPELGVLEDRLTPTPVLSVDPVKTVYEGDAGLTYADFNVSLDGLASALIAIDWSLSNANTNGPQLPYHGQLQMNGGSKATIHIPIVGNTAPGSDQSYKLTLAPEGDLTNHYPTNSAYATLNILDDDAQVVSISNPSAVESAGNLPFVVTLSKPIRNKTITVNYETHDGTAVAGQDYQTTAGTLTFAPGETTKTILVPIINNTVHEGTETMSLLLTDTTNLATYPYATNNAREGAGTIIDDDPPATPNTPPTISAVADRSVPVNQSTGAIGFTVGDAQTPAGSLVVSATSSNPTLVPASGIALGGSGASRTVTVTPVAGQTGTADITLTVTDAGGLTATDKFRLTVTRPAGGGGGVGGGGGGGNTGLQRGPAVFRPSNGTWYTAATPTAAASTQQWGLSGDAPVNGDYDGDGRADFAVWRPSNGTWYVRTAAGTTQTVQWGLNGDLPVAGDYDGDGRTDFAVWRPSTDTWYVRTAAGTTQTVQWGLAGDSPVQGDYDGDGKADFAVWRPSTGTWYVARSGGGTRTVQWGLAGDVPAPTDYDADGKTDFEVWRPSTGTWYIMKSGGGTTQLQWGLPGDVPQPADYDRDGYADLAVWRPSNGTWYVRTADGGIQTVQWGLNGDVPVANTQAALLSRMNDGTPPLMAAVNFGGSDQVPVGHCDFDGDGKTDIATYQTTTGVWSIRDSSTGWVHGVQWGGSGQVPVGGCDFDGDHKTDVVAYRTTDGMWSIRFSSTGLGSAVQWGGSDQVPVGGCDFDGDGKTDLAAYRATDGKWGICFSTTGIGRVAQWGGSDQVPVGGCDFDGDGRTDLAAYRTTDGMWSICYSGTGLGQAVQWGGSGQVPVGGCDFDGDHKTDLAAYRVADGAWSVRSSATGLGTAVWWGGADQVPVWGFDYDGDGKSDFVAYNPSGGGWWSVKMR
jgi:hypothetical protein